MRRLSFTIELLDDVVFSARSASAGGHESLDYVPGAAILGLLAGPLYRKWGATDRRTFDVLHGGKVRFGPGYPLTADGRPTLPIPMSLHEAKGDSCLHFERGRIWINPDKAYNTVCATFDSNQQPAQLRSGFVAGDLELVRPLSHLRMKTSINEETGRAREAQLFGYQALSAGQRFLTTIDFEKDVDQSIQDELCTLLAGEQRMGRSRSAEYGHVRIQHVEETFERWVKPTESRDDTLTLWLLSDACLVDRYGQPTFDLTRTAGWPADLEFKADKSSIRHRSYAPFNGYRRHVDVEHCLLTQGSVLHLEGSPASIASFTDKHGVAGIGIQRERGYGRIWINPPMLGNKHPPKKDDALFGFIYPNNGTIEPAPKTDLIIWAGQRSGERKHREATVTYVDRLVEGLKQAYGSAQALSGSPPSVVVGPGASQWHRIGTAARNADNAEALKRRLFDDDHGICRTKDPDWQKPHGLGIKSTFRDWVEMALFERGGAADLDPIDVAIAFSPKAATVVRELRR